MSIGSERYNAGQATNAAFEDAEHSKGMTCAYGSLVFLKNFDEKFTTYCATFMCVR